MTNIQFRPNFGATTFQQPKSIQTPALQFSGDNFWTRPRTRRQALGIGGTGLLAALLAACGGRSGPTPISSTTSTSAAQTSTAAAAATTAAPSTTATPTTPSVAKKINLHSPDEITVLFNIDNPEEVIRYTDTPENIQKNADGSLSLVLQKLAKPEQVSTKMGDGSTKIRTVTHTSGRIEIPLGITEGRVDTVLTVPYDDGDHSTAFFSPTFPDAYNSKWPPEMVFIESVGSHSKATQKIRQNPITGDYNNPFNYQLQQDTPARQGTHKFSLDVHDGVYTWYVDDKQTYQMTIDEIVQAQIDQGYGFSPERTRAQLADRAWNLSITHAAGPAWDEVGVVPDNLERSELIIHSVTVSP